MISWLSIVEKMGTLLDETIHIMLECVVHLHDHRNKMVPLMKLSILTDISNDIKFCSCTCWLILYSKRRCGHEAFSIHPSVPSSIHGWHHTGEKTLAKINNPPFAHVLLFWKGMPSLSLSSFIMVSCMLLSHGSQAVQTPRFSTARVPMDTCGMWYIERFWKCNL
jgi:hypothetical protein